MEIAPPPLVLSLDPILPLRAPQPGAVLVSSGFRLRLPDGPAVAAGDPLLSAFGARVVDLEVDVDDSEALQDDVFAPGRGLTLLEEGVDEDGDPVVGVWDAAGTRRAGHLDFRAAAEVAAATDAGLAVGAVVLTEDRLRVDDRRCGLEVLVHAPAFVEVETGVAAAVAPHVTRPRHVRERVVLVADGSSELRWWDPSGRGGPMDLGQVPLSSELLATSSACRPSTPRSTTPTSPGAPPTASSASCTARRSTRACAGCGSGRGPSSGAATRSGCSAPA